MPARNDQGSGTTGAGGDSPQEPLIDRQLELDLLRQHIARVTDTGTGHAVLILGESGVGKSRLAVEAAAEARQRGMAVISVRCLGRGAEPLLPLKEALASYLGRTPDQIRRTLARAAPALLDAVPFIGAFLASIGEKLAEGSFSLRGVYEELSRILIKATSGNAGLFLLVDDLHAADPDTLYFPELPVPQAAAGAGPGGRHHPGGTARRLPRARRPDGRMVSGRARDRDRRPAGAGARR
jgi:AAA ATPase domain